MWFHRSQFTSRNAASIPRNVADGPGDPLTPGNPYVGPWSLSTTAYVVYCMSEHTDVPFRPTLVRTADGPVLEPSIADSMKTQHLAVFEASHPIYK